MKYIRTDDDIRLTEDVLLTTNPPRTPLPHWKQSDDLKELVDCYVVVKKKVHSFYTKYQFNRKRADHWVLARQIKIGKKIVLGAIWTDKGLKYVAKMNDKGDLELI